MERYWVNGSGCYDPTAKSVIDNESKEERARSKQVHDTIQEIKNILKDRDMELVKRIAIKDKRSNKKYE